MQREQRLASARQLLSEPSAIREEWERRLGRARAEVRAVLDDCPGHPEALELLDRIDELRAMVQPGPPPDVAKADALFQGLAALIRGSGPRSEVEARHTELRDIAEQLQVSHPVDAAKYRKRARELWALYARRLGKVEDACPGCPRLDVTVLARPFDRARLLGAGDYALDDLIAMKKLGYRPLLSGDFNGDGTIDVALLGRGTQKAKERLFVLIASVQKDGYRRLFLEALRWDKAALTVRKGTLILSDRFYPSDDFYQLRWNGKTFEFRYAGEAMR